MPNWVKSIVTVKSKVQEFKEQFFVSDEEGELRFDFNTIIPMPSDLMITSGSDSFHYLKDTKIKDLIMRTYNVMDTQEEYVDKVLMNLIKEEIPYSEEEGLKDRELDRVRNQAKGYFNLIRYGFEDWYDWSNEKWGTKWNASDTYISVDTDDELVFTISTAWCTPDGIFRKLAEMGFEFTVAYADEDLGNNLGLIKTENNSILYYNLEEEDNPHILAVTIWSGNLYEDDIVSTLEDYAIVYTKNQVKEAIETLQDYVPSY